ncbi:MAG: IS110 family transposase [Phocaeicola sp.]
MKKLFIGIDFSKKTFDVSFFEQERTEQVYYAQFENTKEGFKYFLKWVSINTKVSKELWLVCGEHTGLYSLELPQFLLKKNIFIWLENPLQIKLSVGIKREKTDKVDSLEIAYYAYRFQDKARLYKLPEKIFSSLQNLLSFRGRLVKNRQELLVAAKETRRVFNRDKTARYIYEQSMLEIGRLSKKIKETEEHMLLVLEEMEELKANYDRITSIKGVGIVNALMILIYTENFTRFTDCRKFACYVGVVPFDKSSGTSVHRGKRISRLANVQIKTLLTQAARCAVIHNSSVKKYYERKLADGKSMKVAINNVRNKILQLIFALVQKEQMYISDYQNQWQMKTV